MSRSERLGGGLMVIQFHTRLAGFPALGAVTPRDPRRKGCSPAVLLVGGALCVQHGVRKVPLHGLRHTCVSLLLALGVHPRIVMEIVGHSAIEMTMNIYGHVNVETQRKALENLDKELS